MSLKNAAEELLKVADDIEKEAAETSQFVCDKCNHTATLASINGKRQEVAKEAGEKVIVADVTVNDTVSCPACEGTMAYKATEESDKFYFDPESKEAGEDEEDEEEKKASEPIDYDSLERYSSEK